MAKASSYGAVLLPPVPAFYTRPQTLDDIVNHTVGKAFDQFEILHTLLKRWKEPVATTEVGKFARANNHNS
jgi:4-hydroxy-3-polyprenylbenzoate decarboxylase